jgi:hypothetical protein
MKMSNIINAICLFITACAIGYVIFTRADTSPVIDNSVRNQVLAEAKIIARKVDRDGANHVIVETTNNILPDNLKETEGMYDKAFVDSLTRNIDAKDKEITSLTQISQSLVGKNLQATAALDSANKKVFEYSDKNFYLSYTPTTDSLKAGKFDYRYNQNLNIVEYNKKKWIFGVDRIYTDISSDDPKSTINGVRKISIKRTTKDFAMKLTAKSIYLPVSGVTGSGASVRVRYKRWVVNGSQLYFPQVKQWKPVVGLEFELLNY